MNVKKISSELKIKPTNRKMKEVKKAISEVSGLPKEMPLEKKIYLCPMSETFERIKDKIQIKIQEMRGYK